MAPFVLSVPLSFRWPCFPRHRLFALTHVPAPDIYTGIFLDCCSVLSTGIFYLAFMRNSNTLLNLKKFADIYMS